MTMNLLEQKAENPTFIMTKCATNVMLACAYAQSHGDISLVYGDAGLGKTVSLMEYARGRDNVLYIQLNNCEKSPKGVCERIMEEMGRTIYGSERKLVNEIIERLRASSQLLVLDEAQHLSQRALETLRGINDITHTGLVLCGNHMVYDQMHGKRQAYFAQLYSRIGIRRRATTPTKQEISSIFMKSPLNEQSCEFLHRLSLADGGLRNAVKVYNLAMVLAATSDEPLELIHLTTSYEMVCGDL